VIVVDTNVLAYLYLPGPFTRLAEALVRKDSDWAAPILWRSEFRNILAALMKRSTLTLEQARAIQAEAQEQMAGLEHEVDSDRVLELARDSRCTAYDCEFVALAAELGVSLVTNDAKLLAAFPGHAVALTCA